MLLVHAYHLYHHRCRSVMQVCELEVGRHIENIVIYRRYRYYGYRIVSALIGFSIYRHRTSDK